MKPLFKAIPMPAGELYWVHQLAGRAELRRCQHQFFWVMDQMLAQLADKSHFPYWKSSDNRAFIQPCLLQAYAAIIKPKYLSRITFHYIVTNSQYFYPDDGAL